MTSQMNPGPVPPPLNGRRTAGSWEQFEQRQILELIRSLPDPKAYNHEELLANRRQAAELRARISQYQHSLQRPIQQSHITALSGAICRLKVLLWRMFPFNNLPVEIVVNIFRYAVWSTINSPEGVLLRFRLTWVCRRWRHIAVHDQTLWNTIWFKDVKLGYQRSKLYLERAGTATLDLRIEDDDKSRLAPGQSMSGDDMNRILDILLKKSNQIRMLIVVVELWPPILVLLDRLHRSSRSLQQLERIEIHRTGRPYRWDGPGYPLCDYQHALSLFNGQAQRINFICLNGIHLDWDRACLTNLTNLDLRRMPPDLGPSLERFRYMLESSPNLRKLSLDGAGPMVPMNSAAHSYPPVFLPRLESLVLGDFLVTYAIFYAGIIRAPKVREITVLNLVGEDHAQLFKVLTGKFPELLILALFGVKIRKAAENARIMVQWLLSIPKLKFMRMAGMEADLLDLFYIDGRFHIRNDTPLIPATEMTQAILANGSPISLCPELEAIEVQQIDMNSVVRFVSDRKKLEVPLRKLYIHHNFFESMSPDERAILQKQNYEQNFADITAPMSLTPMEESIWKQVRGG
jgi:F-box-like